MVVADSGLMSTANITELQTNNYQYIIGARIKNESKIIQQKILSQQLKNGESVEISKDTSTKIIINYSQTRAKKMHTIENED